jgi:phage FluMu gp28-like protein
MGNAKIKPKRAAILLPYQDRWVKDKSRLKIAEKSRQIGWSWATSYGLVRRKSLVTATGDAWISSRDDLQARLFLEDSKNFAAILNAGAKDLGEKVIDDKGHSAYVLQFANGLRAHSMSSNPDAQAGKRGDRVLDEFALHPDPRKLYSIAYPGITWGGQMELFSTHRGTANFFNELITEIKHKGNPKGFSLHTVTLQTALDDGFLYKLQSKLPPEDERQLMDEAAYFDFIRAGCADEESFLQEYCCVPGDDASAFLSFDLIGSCCYSADSMPSQCLVVTEALTPAQLAWLSARPGKLYLGMDIGRTKDLTVLWVLEKLGDVQYTRAVIVLEKRKFAEQRAALYDIAALQNFVRGCIDQNGIGRQLAEEAEDKFGEYRLAGIDLTNQSKSEIAPPVKASFEDRSIRVPDDNVIKADLRSIRKGYTPGGKDTYAGERGVNGHADRFWALALAELASKAPKAEFFAALC